MLATQKMEFYERLEKHIQTNINKLKRDKYVVTREMQNTAMSLLKVKKGFKCTEGARLKFWVHEKFYPGYTGKELYCRKTHKPVVVKEDLFDVIHSFHCRIGHRKKEGTWKEVCTQYSWVKRDIIDIYITTCRTCCGGSNAPATNKPMITDMQVSNHGFMTRLTLSVINMEDMPDKDYKFILIVRDCATKYATAWPLKSIKEELIGCLLQFFGQFGPPKFIHALPESIPNMASILEELKLFWPSLIVLHGRANHSAFVGVSERACADLQSKLGAWMAQFEDDNIGWAKGIGSCIFQMNSAISSESLQSPFQSVFGSNPKEPDMLWKTVAFRGWSKEEDVPHLLIKMLESKEAPKDSEGNMEQSSTSATWSQEFERFSSTTSPGTKLSSIVSNNETSLPSACSANSSTSSISSTTSSCEVKDIMTFNDNMIPPDNMTLDMSVEDQVTPDDEIEVKIERVDDEENDIDESPTFTYTY